MLEPIKKDAKVRMEKSLDALKTQLAKLRTGRATTALIDHIEVESYGQMVPLSQVASVTVEDARTITITPWEKTMVLPIEKAIMKSDLGLNPNTAGTSIRLNMPPLTEERRKDLAKVVKSETETARVNIRNVRRDAMQHVKDAVKAKNSGLSTDDEKRAETDIQKLTDQMIAEAEKIMAAKEKEVMTL